LTALALVAGFGPAVAQEIMLDQMVQAGPLFVFPVYGDENSYYYLPDKIRLGTRDNGNPEFAFIKFVRNVADGSAPSAGVAQTEDAGGLVTFTVFLDASEAEQQQARQALSRIKPGARLVGPVAYKSGTFVVLSSFLENDRFTEKVVGFGSAPVFPGHKAAVSMELTAEGATLLWESFGMDTSQISVGFEMVIEGYRNAYEGSIDVDSSQFAANQRIAGGLQLGSMIGIDIDISMKELKDSGAIKIVEKGSTEAGREFLNAAYNKILDYYFEPAGMDSAFMQTLQDDPDMYRNFDKAAEFNREQSERIRRNNREDQQEYERRLALADQTRDTSSNSAAEYLPILDLLPLAEGDRNSGGPGPGGASQPDGPASFSDAFRQPEEEAEPDFSLVAAYRLKTFAMERDFHYEISQFERDTKSLRFDQPLGGSEIRFRRNDPNFFLVVNEDDPAYTQRQVRVSIAGQNAEDFERWVNNVVVQLRKRHQNGDETFREIIVDSSGFADAFNAFTMVYGNLGATRERNWADYEYRALWNLGGGVSWDSGWLPNNQAVINIAPPHRYREVKFKGVISALEAQEVRSANITFYSDFMGEQLTDELSFEVGESPSSQIIEYAYEADRPPEFEYEIRWRLFGNRSVASGRLRSTDDIIYIDELPR
jgi:hypothetical protein